MEHAQSATDTLGLPTAPSDNQVNAQLYYVLAMLVKDRAMKKARNALVGHGSEIWRLLCEEYKRRQRTRFQDMLRVQVREPLGESLDSFERQAHAEDQTGEPILDEMLAATVIALTTRQWHSTLQLTMAPLTRIQRKIMDPEARFLFFLVYTISVSF